MSVVTNADALSAFMQGKSRRFENGEVLTLPGGQRFTVTKITFRKVDKMPYLTFMARCLICSKAYTSVYSVQRLRNGQRLVRTCGCKPGHDVREGSWVPGAELEIIEEARRTLERQRAEDRAMRAMPQRGVAQEAVLAALVELDVLGAVSDDVIVASAARRLPRSSRLQDQRRAIVRRALGSLRRQGIVAAAVAG